MLIKAAVHQSEMEFISIEEFVPANHLLRKIDKVFDFGFIDEIVLQAINRKLVDGRTLYTDSPHLFPADAKAP